MKRDGLSGKALARRNDLADVANLSRCGAGVIPTVEHVKEPRQYISPVQSTSMRQ